MRGIAGQRVTLGTYIAGGTAVDQNHTHHGKTRKQAEQDEMQQAAIAQQIRNSSKHQSQ